MSDEDMDLSNFTSRFKEIREERDLLKTQLQELEKNYARSEAIRERQEHELNHIKSQFENLKATITEKETVIQGIAATILGHIKKSESLGSISPAKPTQTSLSRESTIRSLTSEIPKREAP